MALPALPLVLAGPILRRVEPTLVAVWVALRTPARVRLRLWEGHVSAGQAQATVDGEQPAADNTVRVGEQLHIALALIKLPADSPRKLVPGKLYSYDLQIQAGSQTHTLKSLGLLADSTVDGRETLALGYERDKLPCFALPPQEITDLRVVFGSCRRPYNSHRDAMADIDDLMVGENVPCPFNDPLRRPHQLFLGGDQIYADDVSPVHLHMLMERGRELIGQQADGTPREHLPVDHLRRRTSAGAPQGFDDYGPAVQRDGTDRDADFLLPASPAYFPPGRRYLMTTVDAQLTSVDAGSHLHALGEFAAMYLSVWSNGIWPVRVASPQPRLDLPGDAPLLEAAWPDRIPAHLDTPLTQRERREHDNRKSVFQNYLGYQHPDETDASRREEKEAADFPAHLEAGERDRASERANLDAFERALPRVRRVLANIPTYMVFDDHDVTDDWNLNPVWRNRVHATSLGATMIRNALTAYVLFQDWGNDPLRYESGEPKKVLEQIAALFPPGLQQGPAPQAAEALARSFSLHQNDEEARANPPMKWHFAVPGPRHLAVALDNRTRRSYLSDLGPPGNVPGSLKDNSNGTVQAEQIPAGPFTDGKEVLLVIAPLQVLGPPILDELVAPASFRAFDIAAYDKKLHPDLAFGSRGMAGTNPDAIEAWAFDPVTLEALLRRLEPYRRVVLLSGDVHYSASTAMSYWKKGTADPARFVQFTSSGFKNVMPSYITAVDRSLALAHRIVRAGIGAERLGWNTPPDNPVLLAEDRSAKDINRPLRAKMKLEPTLLPTLGWPRGSRVNPAQLPDWSWRIEPVFDLRPDSARPAAIRPRPIDTAGVAAQLAAAGAPEAAQAYQAVATQHQYALQNLRNSRQILFRSNFGLVRFARRDGVLVAVHEMYTAAPAPEVVGTDRPRPELFVLHEVALAAPQAVRPENEPLHPAAPAPAPAPGAPAPAPT